MINQTFYDYPKTLSAKTLKMQGIVYTPKEIAEQVVKQALSLWQTDKNSVAYDGPPKILDLGCGTGIFMQVAKELCPEAEIFGCDTDEKAIMIAKENGFNNAFVSSFLDIEERYDIIIGNPPYVRIQNLDNETRSKVQNLELTQGDTDLYLAAMEWSLKHAEIVSFITPNSWTMNNSAKKLREYIANNALLFSLEDFGEKQVFAGVQTYVAISTFAQTMDYSITRNGKTIQKTYGSDRVAPVTESNLCYEETTGTGLLEVCDIRVGLATLADRVFYTSEKFTDSVPCVKASRIKVEKNWIIYPYKNGVPILEEDLGEDTHEYLCQHYDRLLARSDTGPKWYTYGRTQGFNTFGPKILIPPAQKDVHGMLLEDEVCYYISGYAAFPKENVTLQDLMNIFESPSYHDFVMERGKPMSSGYRGVNKTILSQYKID
mgnify:CR=1 FL=1